MLKQQPQRSGKSATAGQYTHSHYTALLTQSEACAKLQALGFAHIDKVPASGNGRIPARGKGPNNKGATISWTVDGLAMHWRDFTTDDHGTIFASASRPINRAESTERFKHAERARRKAEVERQARQDRAGSKAQDMYRSSVVISGKHEYIDQKGLSCSYNARLDVDTGALLILMWMSGVGLVNLQRIFPDGTKRFLKGARVKGAYNVIGSLNGAERVFVCEGWATGATLFELYGLPVVVAFNAGNLMPVCQALRSRFDNLTVVIASDDDRQNTVNVGRQKAIEAAEAIGATLLFPELCRYCPCTDHNDAMVCSRRRAHG